MRLCKWFFVFKSWMAVLPSAIFVRFIPRPVCRSFKIGGALAREHHEARRGGGSAGPGAISGFGDRNKQGGNRYWKLRATMTWDNFAIFRTNCATLTTYICEDPRTCRGFSRRCCHCVIKWRELADFSQ